MANISHHERSRATHGESAGAPPAALTRTIHRWVGDESGASAVEYGLLVAFISLGIAAALKALSGDLAGVFSKVTKGLAGL